MSEPQSASTTPAGWYADPSDARLQRYWDGSAWTDRTFDLSASSPQSGIRATVPAGVRTNTPWIWVFAATPLINLLVTSTVDLRRYLTDSLAVSTTGRLGELPASFGTQFLLGAISWGVYLLCVLMAFLDWRQLVRRGVDRPFHWAWGFLSAIVYMIGRSVVLRRRGRSDFAPMWVYLALTVLASTIIVLRLIDAFSFAFQTTPFG